MEQGNKIVKPGSDKTLTGENGERLSPPDGWVFLPAGDARITRKVTAKGIFWRVQPQMGRRIISKGIWAPGGTIALAKQEVEALRSTEAYQKKLNSGRQRRGKKQAEYEKVFCLEVRSFLAFSPKYQELEKEMAEAIPLMLFPLAAEQWREQS